MRTGNRERGIADFLLLFICIGMVLFFISVSMTGFQKSTMANAAKPRTATAVNLAVVQKHKGDDITELPTGLFRYSQKQDNLLVSLTKTIDLSMNCPGTFSVSLKAVQGTAELASRTGRGTCTREGSVVTFNPEVHVQGVLGGSYVIKSKGNGFTLEDGTESLAFLPVDAYRSDVTSQDQRAAFLAQHRNVEAPKIRSGLYRFSEAKNNGLFANEPAKIDLLLDCPGRYTATLTRSNGDQQNSKTSSGTCALDGAVITFTPDNDLDSLLRGSFVLRFFGNGFKLENGVSVIPFVPADQKS